MPKDPRLVGAPRNANEAIQDRAIRHQLFLQRLKTQQANQIIKFLNRDVYPDLLNKLEKRLSRITERGFDTGPATTRRLRELSKVIGDIVRGGNVTARDLLKNELFDISKSEAQFELGLINKLSPVNLELLLPPASQLRSVVTSRPFEGKLLAKWFSDLSAKQQRDINQAVRIGITEGETTQQIIQRIRGTRAGGFMDGVLGTTRRNAEAIARTAVQHVSNQARQSFFEANNDFIKGVKWVATLDTRTCAVCAGLDGQVFPVDSGRRPPAHFNCRCTTTPVLKSFRELGIPAADLPPGTRASMGGQVPADVTYNEWLKNQSKGMQVEALGKTRADLFRTGKLDVGDFTDRKDRAFTLDQLKTREADAFKSAGIE